MKDFLKKHRNTIIGTLLLVIGMVIGIGIATYSPLLINSFSTRTNSISQPVNITAVAEARKQSLEKFYKELSEAKAKEDWVKLYAAVNPSDKKWFSIMDMTLLYKKDKYSVVSTEYIVNNISVLGDMGYIDRTIITCKAKECSGNNKVERSSTDRFSYIDNQWYQQARKEPTEKARQVAAYIYTDYQTRPEDKKLIVDKYGGGIDDLRKIIRNLSIALENDPELFSYNQAWVEKDKTERSRPVVDYQPPAVIQQPNYPKNCTSHTIGSYTYTDCY